MSTKIFSSSNYNYQEIGEWLARNNFLNTDGKINVKSYGATGNGITDDTAAIQAAIDACAAKGGGVVFFPAGVYLVNGFLKGVTKRSRLRLPVILSSNRTISITLEGESVPFKFFGTDDGGQFVPTTNNGSVIKTTVNSGILIGGSGDTGINEDFTAVQFLMNKLVLRAPNNPNLCLVDASSLAQFAFDDLHIDTGVYSTYVVEPTNPNGVAIKMPGINNGAVNVCGNVSIDGFYDAIWVEEHTKIEYLNITSCKHGIVLKEAYHASLVVRAGIQHTQIPVDVRGAHLCDIQQLNLEHANPAFEAPNQQWKVTQFDLRDNSNLGAGSIVWASVTARVGTDKVFTKSGGNKFFIRHISDPINAPLPIVGGINNPKPVSSGSLNVIPFDFVVNGAGICELGAASRIKILKSGFYTFEFWVCIEGFGGGRYDLQMRKWSVSSASQFIFAVGRATSMDGFDNFLYLKSTPIGIEVNETVQFEIQHNAGFNRSVRNFENAGTFVRITRDSSLS